MSLVIIVTAPVAVSFCVLARLFGQLQAPRAFGIAQLGHGQCDQFRRQAGLNARSSRTTIVSGGAAQCLKRWRTKNWGAYFCPSSARFDLHQQAYAARALVWLGLAWQAIVAQGWGACCHQWPRRHRLNRGSLGRTTGRIGDAVPLLSG